MTVADQTRFMYAVGNGSTTVFPYDFYLPEVVDDPEFSVYLVEIATGTITILTLDSDYSISGLGTTDGGNVTYPLSGSPLSSDYRIVLESALSYNQTTDITNSGALYLNTIEAQMDKTARQMQELRDRVERTFSAGIGTGLSLEVQPSAGKLIGWNGAGTALENKDSESQSQAAAAAAALAAQTAQGLAEDAQAAAETAQGLAETAVTNADDAATLAQEWAENPEDIEVTTGHYSALHWAAKSQANAEAGIGAVFDGATDDDPADTSILLFRNADDSWITRSWANLKTLLAGTFVKLTSATVQSIEGGIAIVGTKTYLASTSTPITPVLTDGNCQAITADASFELIAPTFPEDYGFMRIEVENTAGSITATFTGFDNGADHGDDFPADSGKITRIVIEHSPNATTYWLEIAN